MQLSVVIPVYNGARFIEDAVKSIYDQTLLPEDFEIILVEDGSSDNSYEVCQCLTAQHPEIKMLSHEVNKGVAAARNLGIQIAGGDYLAMLDQDDTWHPNKLERQFQVFQDDPSVELVLGLQEFHLVGKDNFPRWFKPAWADAPQPGYVFGCMLTLKSNFLRVGLLDKSLRYGNDDVDWFGRAKSLGVREVLLPKVVLSRKIHALNTSQNHRFSANAELLQVIRRKIGRS